MIEAYNKHQIRRTLYELKKQWGAALSWYIFQTASRNLIDGTIGSTFEEYTIKRAIQLPSNISTVALSVSPLIQLLSSGSYKSYFNTDTKQVIVDIKDLPYDYRDRDPSKQDYILIDSKKYNPEKIIHFEHGLAASIILKHVIS
jgi:hypothetical protein